MQAADFNVDNFSHSGSREADKSLLVKFFYKPKKDQGETKKQGRPIFKETLYVDIKIVGSRGAGACRPASPEDIKRFPDHHKAFIDRTESPEDMGLPLEEWGQITRSAAEELKFFNVKTVEQLAHMADTQVSQFMGLFATREKARTFLLNAEKQKPLAEMEARNEELTKEVKELKTSVANLMNLVEELKPAEKIKRATSRKNKNTVVKAEKILEDD